MKSIKINGLNEPDKESVYTDRLCYTVNLGNGIVKKFSNKAQGQRFLNDVSKYLTYKLHECNELYISAFGYYRRAWFYFDHNKHTSNKLGLYDKDKFCEETLIQISETFNILYRRANWANGNHFVFVHFNNITNGLQSVTEALISLYENKSAPAIGYELQILKTKIVYCQRTIDKYCIELENSFKENFEAEIINLKLA
jgi:hypothetical protein